MTELHNVVNNYQCAACTVGNNLMSRGEVAFLAVKDYLCNDGLFPHCSSTENMLGIDALAGGLHCITDRGECVLDGQNQRRGIYVTTGIRATTGAVLLRGLKFYRGQGIMGGGMVLTGGAKVDLVLCRFQTCMAIGDTLGGGAIFVSTR